MEYTELSDRKLPLPANSAPNPQKIFTQSPSLAKYALNRFAHKILTGPPERVRSKSSIYISNRNGDGEGLSRLELEQAKIMRPASESEQAGRVCGEWLMNRTLS